MLDGMRDTRQLKKDLFGQKTLASKLTLGFHKGLKQDPGEKDLFFPFWRKAIFEVSKIHGSIKNRQHIRN
jgi:hypothetical protein